MTLAVAILLVPLAIHYWLGWMMWAVLLLAIGFRHPPLIDRWQPLDPQTSLLGSGGAGHLRTLCFMPAPIAV